VTMLGAGEPREVRVASVSDGLLALLGMRVAAGRAFTGDDHRPGRGDVAILDHGFWQRALGGDPAAIGRSLTIGGRPYTVVGILEPRARLPEEARGATLSSDADAYWPLEYSAAYDAGAPAQRRSNFLGVFARARSDLTAARIDDDMRRIATELQAAFPGSNAGLSMNAIAVQEHLVGEVRRPLLILLGAVGFVLLVAGVNVAHLMLARASGRENELAVRAALGAGRGRLLRQLLTEALVLGAAPWHGRIWIGSAKSAEQSLPPGMVLPAMVHGGPGRAGGGEELGGRRGMSLYMQRTALQGDRALIEAIASKK